MKRVFRLVGMVAMFYASPDHAYESSPTEAFRAPLAPEWNWTLRQRLTDGLIAKGE